MGFSLICYKQDRKQMKTKKEKKQGQVNSSMELVTVAFAEDMDLAKEYRDMLKENEIPCAIKAKSNPASDFDGVAILVPEDFLDEAHELIESKSSVADFYDLAFGDDSIELDDEADDVQF
jgi:hypothetical protein